MYKYYSVTAVNSDGESGMLFGSYDRNDCKSEMNYESMSWKMDGYTRIKIEVELTEIAPDTEIYSDDFL